MQGSKRAERDNRELQHVNALFNLEGVSHIFSLIHHADIYKKNKFKAVFITRLEFGAHQDQFYFVKK